jgi:hypothetical protein
MPQGQAVLEKAGQMEAAAGQASSSCDTETVSSHTDRLRAYFKTLGPSAKAALLAEFERGALAGEDGTNVVLTSLRLDLRESQNSAPRIGNPSRVFFEPIEPLLADAVAGDGSPRGILRGSLGPMWAWICRDLLPGAAQAYSEAAKRAILAGDKSGLQQLAREFRQRVFEQARKELATLRGKERTHERLAAFGAPDRALGDVCRILTAFQSKDAPTASV